MAATAAILYFLTIGIAVDSMDAFVEADIASGAIPDVSILNYVLAVYTIVIAGSMLVSAVLLSHDARIAGVSILSGLIMTGIVTFVGLMGIPELQMAPDKWLIAPALYTAFVVKDPNTFLFMEATCMASVYLLVTLRIEVFN